MAYPLYIKEKARKMRREKKLTIDELAERMAISRTTIYHWVRDLPIPRTGPGGGFCREATRKAALANSRKFRQLRQAAYDRGVDTFDWFDGDPEFRDFVVLYIAEGYKRCRNTVSLANSDPQIIRLAWRWIDRFSCREPYLNLQYHRDQDPHQLTKFWMDALGIREDQISLIRKSNSGNLQRRVWRCRYGVASVVSNDTYFRAELQAWIDGVTADWL